jgi:hypothetical protein
MIASVKKWAANLVRRKLILLAASYASAWISALGTKDIEAMLSVVERNIREIVPDNLSWLEKILIFIAGFTAHELIEKNLPVIKGVLRRAVEDFIGRDDIIETHDMLDSMGERALRKRRWH